MSNPLYDQLGGGAQNGLGGMLNAFKQFKSAFTGDPQQQVQQLLNSGRMTQAQFNQLSQMANQLMDVLK